MEICRPMSRKICRLILFLLLVLTAPSDSFAAVDFERLNGSDLGMGIGARAMGFGGAYVSMADDASGVFWNPAGLVDLTRHQLSFSVDLPADLSDVALVLKPTFWGLGKWNVALGIAGVNRLSFKGDSGDGTWEGAPSYFLDVSMIDMEDNFSGTVDSQTRDARISLALTLPKFRKLSLGVNFIYVD